MATIHPTFLPNRPCCRRLCSCTSAHCWSLKLHNVTKQNNKRTTGKMVDESRESSQWDIVTQILVEQLAQQCRVVFGVLGVH